MPKKVKYEALVDFTDLQDKDSKGKGKIYEKDAPFPRPANKKIEDERIQELLSHDNRRGFPVIKEIE